MRFFVNESSKNITLNDPHIIYFLDVGLNFWGCSVTWPPHSDSPFCGCPRVLQKNLPIQGPTGHKISCLSRPFRYRITRIWSISVSVLWEIALKETLTSLSRLFLSKALSKAWPPSCATHRRIVSGFVMARISTNGVGWLACWFPSEVWRTFALLRHWLELCTHWTGAFESLR